MFLLSQDFSAFAPFKLVLETVEWFSVGCDGSVLAKSDDDLLFWDGVFSV